jgi:hypothetical protein
MMVDRNQRLAVPLRWLDRRSAIPWWWIGLTVCDSTLAAQWEGVGFHGELMVTVVSGSCTPSTADHQLQLNNLDATGSSSSKMARESYTPYQGCSHHSWLERGPPI